MIPTDSEILSRWDAIKVRAPGHTVAGAVLTLVRELLAEAEKEAAETLRKSLQEAAGATIKWRRISQDAEQRASGSKDNALAWQFEANRALRRVAELEIEKAELKMALESAVAPKPKWTAEKLAAWWRSLGSVIFSKGNSLPTSFDGPAAMIVEAKGLMEDPRQWKPEVGDWVRATACCPNDCWEKIGRVTQVHASDCFVEIEGRMRCIFMENLRPAAKPAEEPVTRVELAEILRRVSFRCSGIYSLHEVARTEADRLCSPAEGSNK